MRKIVRRVSKRKFRKELKKENLELTEEEWKFFKLLNQHMRLLFNSNPFGHKTEKSRKKYWKKVHKADDVWFKLKRFKWKEENAKKGKNEDNL